MVETEGKERGPEGENSMKSFCRREQYQSMRNRYGKIVKEEVQNGKSFKLNKNSKENSKKLFFKASKKRTRTEGKR